MMILHQLLFNNEQKNTAVDKNISKTFLLNPLQPYLHLMFSRGINKQHQAVTS